MGGLIAAIPAIAALGSIAAAAISTVVNIVLSIGLSLLQKLLIKKPKAPATGSEERVSIRQANAPWRVVYGETRVAGVFGLVNAVSNNHRLQIVVVLAGHEVEAIGDIWFDDEIITLDGSGGGNGGGGLITAPAKWANLGLVAVHKWLGTADQAADTTLIGESPDKWTADHRLRGRAYIVVFLNYSQDAWPNGVPNITAVVKGKKVYDPRSDTTYWTPNAALCLADYLNNATYGMGAAYGTEIDTTALSTAANVCDENVSLAAGGTEDRYTVNGSFTTDAKPFDVLGDLQNAMAGRVYHIGGRWRIKAGAWEVPAVTFDEDDLRGPFKVQSLLSRRDNFNAVKGQHVNPDNNYQETDFPAVVSATYQAEDGGTRVYKDIRLPFTATPSACQRLAKIDLLRARQPITLDNVPFHLSAYRVQPGDVVQITNTRMGWTAKAFEVTRASLVIDSTQDVPLLAVNMSFRETASTTFDWSTSEETAVDPAPNTDLPDVFNVLPPTGLAVTEELYVTRDGAGVKTLARLDWVASPDAFVERYEVQYQLAGGSDWSTARETTALFLEVFDLAPGTYDVRVRAINGVGVRSAWVTVRSQLAGLLAAPTEPQNLTIQSIGGLAVLSWTQSPDLDVRIGGRLEFRHSPATGGSATWMQSTSIGIAVPGTATQVVVPLVAGTYLAKAVDSSGVYSTNPATVETEQATALGWANVGSITEHPAFGGTFSGCYKDVDDGYVKLSGSSNIDTWASVDAVANWDSEGGLTSSGTYTFSAGLDLGSVTRVRLTATLKATIVNVLDKIDSRSGMVDDWVDWDGTQAASADAWVEVRKTNDNPAGSPTWTDWERLDAAELVGRGFQGRARLQSNDPAYNIEIEQLSLAAETVA